MANNDAELTLGLNISQAEKKVKDLSSLLKDAFSKIEGKGLTEVENTLKDLMKTTEGLDTAVTNIKGEMESTVKELQDLREIKAPILDEIAGAERGMKRLQAAWYDTWKYQPDSAGAKKNREQYEMMAKDLEHNKGELSVINSMEKELTDKITSITTEASTLSSTVDTTTKSVQEIVNNVDGIASKEKEAADEAKRTNEELNNMDSSAKSASASIDGIEKELKDVSKAADNADSSISGIGTSAGASANANNISGTGSTNATLSRLASLYGYYQKFRTLKWNINDIFAFTSANQNIGELCQRLQQLREAKKQLEERGLGEDTWRVYSAVVTEIDKTTAKIREYKREAAGVSKSNATIQSAMSGLAKGMQKAGSVAKSMVSTVKRGFSNITKTINKVKSSFDNMARSMRSNFKHMITNITKYVLGFRSLFFLIRRLRKYLGEGIQNLVQFADGSNIVNESITDMLSSLLFLKNAWAAAFAPIIEFVRPVLVNLINTIAEVGNAIARLLSVLLGCEVTFNAVRVSAGDYAEKLGGVGDSAGGAADKVKKLNDRLADFDDLNVLGKDKDDEDTGSGGGGGGGSSDLTNFNEMFKIVEGNNKLADMIREAWANADFTDIGMMIRDKINAALLKAQDFLDDLRPTAYKLGKSLITLLNGVFGDKSVWVNAGKTLGKTVNVVSEFVHGLLENNTTDYGGGLAELVNNFINATDWDLIGANITSFVQQLKENIMSFLNNLQWEDEVVKGAVPGEDYVKPGILTAVQKLFDAIHTAIINVAGDAEFLGSLGTALGNIINTIIVAWSELVDEDDGEQVGNALYTFFHNAIQQVDWKELGENMSGSMTEILNAITTFFSGLNDDPDFQQALDDFVKAFDWDTVFTSIGETIKTSVVFTNELAAAFSEALGKPEVKQGILDGFANLMGSITSEDILMSVGHIGAAWIANFFGLDLDNPEDVALLDEAINNFIADFLDRLARILDKYLTGGMIFRGKNIVEGTTETLTEDVNADSPWYDIATNIVRGLREGISRAIEDEFKNSPFAKIIDGAKAVFKIESPSKVFEEIGEFIIEGLVNGINNLIDTVLEPFNKLKDDLLGGWEQLKTDASEKWGNIKDSITERFGEAKDWVEEKSGIIKDTLTGAWDTIKSNTEERWTTVKDTVTEAIGTAKDTVEDKVSSIKANLESDWNSVKDTAVQKWTEVKDNVIENFGLTKEDVEENSGIFKENMNIDWEEMKTNAFEKWTGIKNDITTKAQEFKTDTEQKVTTMKTNLTQLFQDIKGSAYEKFTGLKNNTVEIFRAMANDIKAPLNSFIGAIERMVNSAIDAINSLFDKVNAVLALGSEWLAYLGLPSLPKLSHLSYVSVPRLAQGAVIPPNNEFLAILGDQSHGTNIEAPLDTIKQAVAEVVGNNNNEEVIELLQQLIQVVENKELKVGDREIGQANARYVKNMNIIRGTSY